MNTGGSSSLLNIIKGINLNKILSFGNKTLGYARQAIPVYKQVQPMWGNLKKYISVYKEVKKDTPEVDTIKESRPLKIITPKTSNRNGISKPRELNDTLTFFQ